MDPTKSYFSPFTQRVYTIGRTEQEEKVGRSILIELEALFQADPTKVITAEIVNRWFPGWMSASSRERMILELANNHRDIVQVLGNGSGKAKDNLKNEPIEDSSFVLLSGRKFAIAKRERERLVKMNLTREAKGVQKKGGVIHSRVQPSEQFWSSLKQKAQISPSWVAAWILAEMAVGTPEGEALSIDYISEVAQEHEDRVTQKCLLGTATGMRIQGYLGHVLEAREPGMSPERLFQATPLLRSSYNRARKIHPFTYPEAPSAQETLLLWYHDRNEKVYFPHAIVGRVVRALQSKGPEGKLLCSEIRLMVSSDRSLKDLQTAWRPNSMRSNGTMAALTPFLKLGILRSPNADKNGLIRDLEGVVELGPTPVDFTESHDPALPTPSVFSS